MHEGLPLPPSEAFYPLWAMGSRGKFCAERGGLLHSVLGYLPPVLSLTHLSLPSQAQQSHPAPCLRVQGHISQPQLALAVAHYASPPAAREVGMRLVLL